MAGYRDTLPARFFANASRLGNQPAHYYLIGGEQYPVGWSTMARVVRDLAAGLVELGHQPGDKVAIVAGNRREWLYWDLACLSVGGVTVGIHPNLSDDEVHAVLIDAEVRFCVVDTATRAQQLHRHVLPVLERVIVLDADGLMADGTTTMSQAELRRMTRRESHREVPGRLAELTSADAAAFVYTEAATGRTCAAMFTHGALVSAVDCLEAMDFHDDDRGFSHMPLASGLQRIADYLFMCRGIPWCYSAAGTLADAPRFRPTVLVVDSLGLEDAMASVYDYATQLPVPVDRLLTWARAVGRAAATHRDQGKAIPGRLSMQMEMMRRLVFERVPGPWGSQVRMVLCHGKPPAQELLDFLGAAGVPLAEVWGPPEALGIVTINPLEHRGPGTVGGAGPGVELFMDDEELCVRADHLFSGYFKRDAETALAFDNWGRFESGVLASDDGAGRVVLRGERRHVIVTASGFAVSPEPIERMLTADPRIRQAVVVGNGRASLAALVSVTPAVRATVSEGELHSLVESIIAAMNLELPRAAQLTGIRLLPYELTAASGELTPSQEVRRHVVYEKFSYLIDEMY